jgi:hypothetical protein
MSESLVDLAESANKAISGDAPYIDTPPKTSVSLIRGVMNTATEEWETSATVRELTGEDEEALAALDAEQELTYNDYIGQLLSRAVVSVGSQTVNNNPTLIDDLIIGDRDLLFLGVIRATYGRYRELRMTCGNCGESNDVKIDLDEDFKVHDDGKDLTKPVSVALRDGSTVSFNLPTAGDSRLALKRAKTLAEQNTQIVARCLIGSMGKEEREAWAKKLGVADRKNIIKALTSAQPGPRMGEVETQCAHCEKELTVVLDWVSLLFG